MQIKENNYILTMTEFVELRDNICPSAFREIIEAKLKSGLGLVIMKEQHAGVTYSSIISKDSEGNYILDGILGNGPTNS